MTEYLFNDWSIAARFLDANWGIGCDVTGAEELN
jgi:hypothetical protein